MKAAAQKELWRARRVTGIVLFSPATLLLSNGHYFVSVLFCFFTFFKWNLAITWFSFYANAVNTIACTGKHYVQKKLSNRTEQHRFQMKYLTMQEVCNSETCKRTSAPRPLPIHTIWTTSHPISSPNAHLCPLLLVSALNATSFRSCPSNVLQWPAETAPSALILLAITGISLLGAIHIGVAGACAVAWNGSSCNYVVFFFFNSVLNGWMCNYVFFLFLIAGLDTV